MKKLIAVLTLLLAITISANAQDKKLSNEESARLDAVKLTEYLDLKATQQQDFTRLFQMKYKVLNNPDLTVERKKEMSRVVDLKIRASLTEEQMKKLEANPALLEQLTGTAAAKPVQAAK